MDGDFVLAHLERTGPDSVQALVAAAVKRGYARAEGDTDIASVVVMSAGCSALEVWGVPNVEALAWWADAANFRPVSREQYFAAFPRVDDGRDRNEEWKTTIENLQARDGED
ncbi:hypothetical protein [Actinomycetospora flava]|uniref:Uncharacterized protein n=1 Tax=Actinomycetospora flava TaxID=3129232 RepID=A0ABU8MF47_9PSEU